MVTKVRAGGTKVDLMIVLSHMGNGGAQRVISELLPLWIDQGAKVVLVLGRSSHRREFAYKIPAGVRVVTQRPLSGWGNELEITRPIHVVRSLLHLRRAIRQMRASTVLSLICPSNIKTIVASAGLGVPRLVVSERNNPARQEFPIHVRLGRRWLYRYADVVTANSEGACAWLRRMAPRNTIEYLPNPVEIPSTVDRPMDAGARIRLIYVGRLVSQKRVRELIRVLSESVLAESDIVLTLVGSGPERESLQQLAYTLGVEDRVEFAGQVTDVRRFYEASDIFVLLSRYEGMPNALLEAMAWKIAPIVSEEVNESTCLIDHGRNGMVVDGQRTAEVAEMVRSIADDAALRRRVAEEAKKTAAEYSTDRVFREWNRILGLDKTVGKRTSRGDVSVDV